MAGKPSNFERKPELAVLRRTAPLDNIFVTLPG